MSSHYGWFVGFIENGDQQYIFVSNLTDIAPASTDKFYGKVALKPYGSQILKPIILKLLNEYFVKNKVTTGVKGSLGEFVTRITAN